MPAVLSSRFSDGRVECALGACLVLNGEGWILTAAHMLEAPASLSAPSRPGSPEPPGDIFLTNLSFWLGVDGWSVDDWHVLRQADVAAGRLAGFSPGQLGGYPVFQTGSFEQGASLCRLGFPFHSVAASYDDAADRFVLDPAALPIPRFPSEGIMTRLAIGERAEDPAIPVRFIETSNAGLRGQSGGPIFDVDGHVWGIQVSTRHLPLGFDPQLEAGGVRVTEHQFMNVGMGASSETVLAFLRELGVTVAVSPD
jgi:hypothetical protein